MNEQLLMEEPVTLKAARSHFASKPSMSTIRRWTDKKSGLILHKRGKKTRRVVLESYLDGGVRVTTIEAIRRFRMRLNGEPE